MLDAAEEEVVHGGEKQVRWVLTHRCSGCKAQ
jgi:hypothetical protein